MGLVSKLSHQPLQARASHLQVECTYDVVTDEAGQKYLQLDTYGSSKREFPGKKSQCIRFTPEALVQLKEIIRANNL